MNDTPCQDSNVEKNVALLRSRSNAGLKKYGTTTDNNPLTLKQWLQHALEECLDQANYLQSAITEIDRMEERNNAKTKSEG